jgi:hypothetical protein
MHECAHDPCNCEVEESGECCSDACREAVSAGSTEESCPCGHDECL